MGLKDKMMDSMIGKMSKEEKMEMMNSMMEKFFDGMSNEEKNEMMSNMMPKMMDGMMGGMMKNMMGSKNKENNESFNPMDMCRKMMSGISESRKVSTLVTPEIRALFEEWAEQIENEILDKIKDKENIDVNSISKEFKISNESTYYFV